MDTSIVEEPINSLDTAQVLLIIEACARQRVSTIKFRGLEITFGPQAQVSPVSLVPELTTTVPLTPDAKMSEPKLKNSLLPNGWDQLELEQKERYISELQLTDPLAAEELLESGELIDVDDQPGDDE